MTSDNKENGMGAMAFGLSLIMIGNSFLIVSNYFLIKGIDLPNPRIYEIFLALGNVYHLCGVAFIFWLQSALHLFKKPTNIKGMILFGVGFLFIINGWPFLGLIFEAHGFFFYLYSDVVRVTLQMISSKIPLCIEVEQTE